MSRGLMSSFARHLFLLVACHLMLSPCFSQSGTDQLFHSSDAAQRVFDGGPAVPEAAAGPVFPGGADSLKVYLERELRMPAAARAAGVKGVIIPNFQVDVSGAIGKINLIGNLGHGCEEEVLRLLAAMPKWIPARFDGRPVPAMTSFQVRFGE